MDLPDEYISEMKQLLGDELDDYLSSFSSPRLYGLRVNISKISTEEFEKISPFPIRKIPYISNGYFYDGDTYQPALHPYYYAGLYYLQDPSAMTPASRLHIDPGDKILDLCAAPGGKATELAARLMTAGDGRSGDGILVANDISASRAKALQKNIELFGVKSVLITAEYPQKLSEVFCGYFDKILIDAPCSGEGMFRKDPSMIRAWTPDSPEKYARLQRDIVRHALSMLAPGGELLYSTCTFSSVEDEGTVEYILSLDPSLHLADIEGYEGFSHGRTDKKAGLEKCVRIFPHKMEGEGHFLALFKKDGAADSSDSEAAVNDAQSHQRSRNNTASSRSSGKISEEEKALWHEFADNLESKWSDNNIEAGNSKLYYMNEDLRKITGLRFLRNGLYLGECKKKRFEPSQALAMSLKKHEYKNCLDMASSDSRVIRYLKGETITVSGEEDNIKDGYVLVCVDGFPLGWGKKSAARIKNKYHSGWRMV
ncbi:MAG: RsmB/NOP family class I SAM-dependent RNA methyltransferase [Eubacterium sp.]|nr:RsmB/NOP family class I SAM-dependent RNA methyltransferase [Eubacterium sp.]